MRTFWSSETEWNNLMASGTYEVAVIWSGSASRSAQNFGLPVEFVVPEEGAIGWFDGLSIPTDAPNREAAHAFIDFMVDPEFYVRWDTDVGAPASANLAAMEQLPEGAFNRDVLGDPAVAARLTFMGPMDDAQREAFLALWQEVRTELAE